MDKILYEEIALLPVASADFKQLNKQAEDLLTCRHPTRKDIIKEDRDRVFQFGCNCLKDYRKKEELEILQLHRNVRKYRSNSV
jgi:hypothetical protein